MQPFRTSRCCRRCLRPPQDVTPPHACRFWSCFTAPPLFLICDAHFAPRRLLERRRLPGDSAPRRSMLIERRFSAFCGFLRAVSFLRCRLLPPRAGAGFAVAELAVCLPPVATLLLLRFSYRRDLFLSGDIRQNRCFLLGRRFQPPAASLADSYTFFSRCRAVYYAASFQIAAIERYRLPPPPDASFAFRILLHVFFAVSAAFDFRFAVFIFTFFTPFRYFHQIAFDAIFASLVVSSLASVFADFASSLPPRASFHRRRSHL